MVEIERSIREVGSRYPLSSHRQHAHTLQHRSTVLLVVHCVSSGATTLLSSQ